MLSESDCIRVVAGDEVDKYETTIVKYNHDDESDTVNNFTDCADQFVTDKKGDLVRKDPGQLIISTSDHQLRCQQKQQSTSLTIINPPPVPPLLNEQVANVISHVTIATRLALRLSQIILEAFFETVRYGTLSSLSLTKAAFVAAISAAKPQRRITSGNACDPFVLARVMDRSTTAGIYLIHNTFSLAELFFMSSFNLVSKTLTLSLRSAEEAVRVIDGLFGSTETSRALAAFVYLVKNELDEWMHELELTYPAPFGHAFAIGSVTKGITAYSCLQYVSRKRQSIKAMKLTPVFDYALSDANTLGDLDVSRQVPSADFRPTESPTASVCGSPSRRQDLLPVIQHPREDSAVCLSVPHAEEFDAELPPVQFKRTLSSIDFSSHRSPPVSARVSRWATDRCSSAPSTSSNTGSSRASSKTTRRHQSLPRYERSDAYSGHYHLLHKPVIRIHGKTPAPCIGESTPTRACSPPAWDYRGTSPSKVPSLISAPLSPSLPRKGGIAISPLRSRKSSSSLHSLSMITLTSATNSNGSSRCASPSPITPHRRLLARMSRFLAFSCGAYGTHFVRILGLNNAVEKIIESRDHHHNVQTFASLAGIPLECILTSSFNTPRGFTQPTIKALVHYVAVDPLTKSIVLTLRGTLGLSDLLTDLTCEYNDYVTAVAKGFVHAGMLKSAKKIYESAVADVVSGALRQYPSFGLVLCGHSLGGGVAALLATMWANRTDSGEFYTNGEGIPGGRPIHCYSYGPPSTMSAELSKAYKNLITCVVYRNDVIPCLSLGLIRDFKTVAVALAQEQGTAEKVISRALHIFRGSAPLEWDSDPDDVWEWSLLKTLRAGMSADKTFPPGTVYWISAAPAVCGGGPSLSSSSPSNGSVNGQHVYSDSDQHTGTSLACNDESMNSSTQAGINKMAESNTESKLTIHRCEDVEAAFSEAHFSTSMFADHAPSSYATALESVVSAARNQGGFDDY